MKITQFVYCISGVLLLGLLTGGCSQTATVVASDPICSKSVEVHLVGVNRFEKDLWETTSMTDYWTPGSQLRKSAEEYTYVIQFGRGPCEVALDKKDPILKVWKKRKAEYLFVLADLPGVYADSAGNADSRRLRLPALGSKRWGMKKKDIDIRVEESNIVSLTVPKSD
ncbi:MAG: hypothetical protein GQ528_11195 [Woeseiaceae bacterium]|nr:hypothetical protein [Woeseiaceae bacterium]